jgi:hypothetical protein
MSRLREILEQMKNPAFITRPGTREQGDPEEPTPPLPMEGMEGTPNPNKPIRPSAFNAALQTPQAQEQANVQPSPELTPRQRMLRHMMTLQGKAKQPEQYSEMVLSGSEI